MLARKEKINSIAKERLRSMMESEPVECTPEVMSQMKKEISDIINRYFDVSPEQYEIKVVLKQTRKRA